MRWAIGKELDRSDAMNKVELREERAMARAALVDQNNVGANSF